MSVLRQIVAAKRGEAASLRARRTPSSFRDEAAFAVPARSFSGALRSAPGTAVIAEIKKASPSAGSLNAGALPADVARSYRDNGAAAVSVLTDGRWFSGSGADLASVRSVVDLPLLRKDFIVDPIQVPESRALGADAILLIAAILEAGEIEDLRAAAAELGMESLVEIHRPEELEKLDLGTVAMAGINNRNLADLTVDLGTTPRIAGLLPAGVLVVSESGLRTAADVRRMARAGARAVLMGECFMTAPDPGRELKRLLDDLREG